MSRAPHLTPPATAAEASLDDPVIEAERAVLAAMLLGDEAIPRARMLLDASDFFRTGHQRIFAAIVAVHDRSERADSITVSVELRARGDLEVVGGHAAIASIFDMATTTANLEEHAAIVVEACRKRRLKRLGLDLQERAEDHSRTSADIVAHLEGETRALVRARDEAGANRFAGADMGWNELLNLELPPTTPILASPSDELLLPRGAFAVFHGDGGVGKTHTMLGLSHALDGGLLWLGLTTPPGGVVVGYLSLELPIDELKRRAARYGVCSRVWLLSRPRLKGAVNFNGSDREALRHWIQARGLEVVIIDALQRVHDGDETREDIAPLLEWLHELAAETGCTIILLHHDKKPDANSRKVADDAHTARGTTVIETTPGVRVHMYRQAECRVLKWRKNWFGPEPVIYTRLDSNGVPVACEPPGSAAKARGAATREQVAQAMRDGFTDADEIAKRVGKSRSTVFEHMKAVRESGQSELDLPDCHNSAAGEAVEDL